MFFNKTQEDKDVIYVYMDESANVVPEYRCDQLLEGRGYTASVCMVITLAIMYSSL